MWDKIKSGFSLHITPGFTVERILRKISSDISKDVSLFCL